MRSVSPAFRGAGAVLLDHGACHEGQQALDGCIAAAVGGQGESLQEALEQEVVALGHQLLTVLGKGEEVFRTAGLLADRLVVHQAVALKDFEVTTDCRRRKSQFRAQLVNSGGATLQAVEDT